MYRGLQSIWRYVRFPESAGRIGFIGLRFYGVCRFDRAFKV